MTYQRLYFEKVQVMSFFENEDDQLFSPISSDIKHYEIICHCYIAYDYKMYIFKRYIEKVYEKQYISLCIYFENCLKIKS